MNLGIFIGRLNPPHLGHLSIIDKSLKENTNTLVLLWTPSFENDSDPLNFEQRKNLLNKKYEKLNSIFIKEILDNHSDEVWIKNIINIIDNFPLDVKTLNIYGWDFKNDSVYNTIKKYEKLFVNYSLNFIEVYRWDMFISHNWKKYNISATKVRELCKYWDINFLSKLCDESMLDEIANKLPKL